MAISITLELLEDYILFKKKIPKKISINIREHGNYTKISFVYKKEKQRHIIPKNITEIQKILQKKSA